MVDGYGIRHKSHIITRKNCNAFVDCALSFLIGERLDAQYTKAESIGRLLEEHLSLVQVLSGGRYAPNPKADDFDVDEAVDDLRLLRLRGCALCFLLES